MYVCNCHGVREQEIAHSIEAGHTTLRALRETLGVGTCCGKCVCDVRRQLHESLAEQHAAAQHACPGHCAAGHAHEHHPGHPHPAPRSSGRMMNQSPGVAELAVC